MTDVDWHRWAHSVKTGASAPCSSQSPELYFEARGDKGATLDALAIRCGRCDGRRTLKELLNQNSLKRIGQRCWGRQPWQRRSEETSCDQAPRVLQRGQTAVHYADIASALDLTTVEAEEASQFDEVMQGKVSALGVTALDDAEPFVARFARSASGQLGRTVGETEVREWLERHFLVPVADAVPIDAFSEQQVLLEEWATLTTPTGCATTRAPLVVRRDRESESACSELKSLISNVHLVERLREVRAFRAFRRVRPDGVPVPPDLGTQPRQTWLPAIEAGVTLKDLLER